MQDVPVLGLDRDFVRRLYGGFDSAETSADFSFGIEEEYFLARRSSGTVVTRAPDSLFNQSEQATQGRIGREFLQSQIEVATLPFTDFAAARAELRYIRRVLSFIAAEHGLAILACGTHPTARWNESVQTEKAHYDNVMRELQMVGRRNMLCGMHVHVQTPDPDRRVEIMCRLIPFVPLLLALSTSSPFWARHRTGLRGYRLAAYDELPRTGLPELFRDKSEFDAYVHALVSAGVIRTSAEIWWSVRPSLAYPTLELRAPDCCTRLEDAISIAALYRCIVRRLYLDPGVNAGITNVDRAVAIENKWRAQRHGVHGSFVGRRGDVSVADFLEETLDLLSDDAQALACEAELAHCRTIVREGTSADEQIRVFEKACPEAGNEAALGAVLAWVAENTVPN
ncbi:MAG: carboxylate-amine ligase [Hyphomicrobiales bacterium]|nr:carboxylate-amine ligase [Hyphomicrobiales bacterium]